MVDLCTIRREGENLHQGNGVQASPALSTEWECEIECWLSNHLVIFACDRLIFAHLHTFISHNTSGKDPNEYSGEKIDHCKVVL